MTKITFLDKNNNLIKTIEPKRDDLFNKTLKRKNSILDLALVNQIPIQYGCMGGSCSACKCQILKGEELIEKEGLKKAVYKDIKKDEFLTCISTLKETEEKQGKIEIKLLF